MTYKLSRTGIEYGDYTWSPFSGCLRECPYECWARKLAKTRLADVYGPDFKPKFYPERLQAGRIHKGERFHSRNPSLPKGEAMVLTGFMGDICWQNMGVVEQVLRVVRESPWNQYVFLTKDPRFYALFDWPKNAWLGITVESENEMYRLTDFINYTVFNKPQDCIRWVSFEPLTGPIRPGFLLGWMDWVVIGGCTGEEALPIEKRWVSDLVDTARRYDGAVFIKDNIEWMYDPPIREWPKVKEAREG